MMTVPEIMSELEAHGSESIKKTLLKHGVKEPFFGVKIAYLKPIQNKIKKNYQLAKDLYSTGNADAMYLAGLIADDEQMSKADLQIWADQALSDNIAGHTVPWVATGSKHGYELAMEWIDSADDRIAVIGWSTLNELMSLKQDAELDLTSIKTLLQRVAQTIHTQPNQVRKIMNNFIIATGTYVAPLTEDAIATAQQVGAVTVDMNGTACKVPDAVAYIMKAKNNGVIGKKKKTVKC